MFMRFDDRLDRGVTPMKPCPAHLLSALALFLLVATASQAVVIYFKDGSKEVVADSYRIDGQRVIAVLQSGQETADPARRRRSREDRGDVQGGQGLGRGDRAHERRAGARDSSRPAPWPI